MAQWLSGQLPTTNSLHQNLRKLNRKYFLRRRSGLSGPSAVLSFFEGNITNKRGRGPCFASPPGVYPPRSDVRPTFVFEERREEKRVEPTGLAFWFFFFSFSFFAQRHPAGAIALDVLVLQKVVRLSSRALFLDRSWVRRCRTKIMCSFIPLIFYHSRDVLPPATNALLGEAQTEEPENQVR